MDWKEIVKAISPIIGSCLGGPLAGGAVKVLADGLLGNEKASEKAVADFITQASPEQLMKVKELEIGFAQRMEELGVDVFKLEVDDRKSARDTHKDNTFVQWLTLILTSFIIGLTYTMFYQVIPVENQNTLYMLLGQFITAWTGSIAYWFGTTKNSADKTKALIDNVRK